MLITPLALAAVPALTGCSAAELAGGALGITGSVIARTTPTSILKQAPKLARNWKKHNSKGIDGWTTATIDVSFVTDKV